MLDVVDKNFFVDFWTENGGQKMGGWVDGVESCQVNPMQLVVHFFITLGCEIGHLCYVLWVLCCDTLFGGFRVSPICLLNNWNLTSSQCN